MDLQKLNIKFFVAPPDGVPLSEFIDVFHRWIQAGDGEYHDVADYSHMQAGPGIVLIADGANVSIDETESRRGLLFSQKRHLSGSNHEKLRSVVGAALENCRKLEAEPALRGKLRFAVNEAVIWVNDRLSGTNSEASFQELKHEIEPFAKQLYGDAALSLERDSDPRIRLHVRIKSSAALDLNTLWHNLHN
ncbi:MAG: hypothetical protein ACM3TN_09960 [Alphaproteobacteria bacterium]